VAAVNYVAFRLTSAQMERGVSVMSLRGDLDPQQTPKVDDELETLQDNGARHLILDLLDVHFLHSSVFGVLLKHSRRIRLSGGTLTLVIDNDVTARGIERYLDGHFRIASTLSEAVDNVTSATS
jgi:anti-anti-sigma factor